MTQLVNDPGPAQSQSAAEAMPGVASGRYERADWRSFAAASLVMLLVYAWTLAPGLTLANSGILATGAMYAGVPGNPGHPVWVLYSWLFAHLLPFSNIAWRVAMGSAVASAAACGLVALMTSRGGHCLFAGTPWQARLSARDQQWLRAVGGAIAGLGFGLSRPVWSQAVIVETWALTALLVALALALLMRWALAPEQRRFLIAAALVFGLLLTSAQHLVVLAPAIAAGVLLREPGLGRDFAWAFLPLVACVMLASAFPVYSHDVDELNVPLLGALVLPLFVALAVAVKTAAFGSHWKPCLACGACFLAGLLLCVYPALASMSNPPVNWGYPRSPEGLWHVLHRGQFERVTPVRHLPLFLQQLWLLLLATASKLGWHYIVFVLLPLACVPRLTRHGRLWLSAAFLVWLCAGALLLTQLNPPLHLGATDQLLLHFAPSFIPVACLAGWGLMLAGALVLGPQSPISQE
jgi:hypothetical protein